MIVKDRLWLGIKLGFECLIVVFMGEKKWILDVGIELVRKLRGLLIFEVYWGNGKEEVFFREGEVIGGWYVFICSEDNEGVFGNKGGESWGY